MPAATVVMSPRGCRGRKMHKAWLLLIIHLTDKLYWHYLAQYEFLALLSEKPHVSTSFPPSPYAVFQTHLHPTAK